MKYFTISCLCTLLIIPFSGAAQADSTLIAATDNAVASINANTSLSKQTITAHWTRVTTNERFVWIDTTNMMPAKITMDSTITVSTDDEWILKVKRMTFYYLSGRLIFAEVTLDDWLSKGKCTYVYYYRDEQDLKNKITEGEETKSTVAYMPQAVRAYSNECLKTYNDNLDYFKEKVRERY